MSSSEQLDQSWPPHPSDTPPLEEVQPGSVDEEMLQQFAKGFASGAGLDPVEVAAAMDAGGSDLDDLLGRLESPPQPEPVEGYYPKLPQ